MWLLKSDGTLEKDADVSNALELFADSAIVAVPRQPRIIVEFSATADGRGFSVARQLRARGYTGTLIAGGPLIPDQARHAFQSGFDAVAIDDDRIGRHGEAAWRETVQRATPELYLADTTSKGAEAGIWALRQRALH
ncbi:MAG: DUF934 domain-containing protein [Pseudomonadota bacterium]